MAIQVDIEKKLKDFHLRVKLDAGDETLALLGASGSGKSMCLRCVAGVEKPDRGRIVLNGRVLYDSEKRVFLPPQKRRAGLMFQNYALFPNMTVRANIEAGSRRLSPEERTRAAEDQGGRILRGLRTGPLRRSKTDSRSAPPDFPIWSRS